MHQAPARSVTPTTANTATNPPQPANTRESESDQIAALQHAHNALSTAAWHTARGDIGQALSRIRRAQAHLKTASVTTSGRA